MENNAENKTNVFSNVLIWFGAAVSIAEILTGTYFAPLGFKKLAQPAKDRVRRLGAQRGGAFFRAGKECSCGFSRGASKAFFVRRVIPCFFARQYRAYERAGIRRGAVCRSASAQRVARTSDL